VRVWDNSEVLRSRTVLGCDGIELHDVRCRHERGPGRHTEQADGHLLVLVRRGCFVRNASGGQALLDPTLAYCTNPGDEQRFDHPHAHGDDCTAIALAPDLVASMWGGDPDLPSELLNLEPTVDLEHRALVAAALRGGDRFALGEGAIRVAAALLESADPRRVAAGSPATVARRRALVDSAREALAEQPNVALERLARRLAVSPHHLSRIFHAGTGRTIARHRMRLRARAAMERLAGGEMNLARLAADLGFADQSHLGRVLRSETSRTPSALRRLLSTAA
jgi:AraC-like DNA-binding protein